MKVAGPHAHSSRGKSTACSRGTLREQSSSVCTNDFMGILHLREQNFHPAKCSTIFNRLNICEQAPEQIERTWKRSLVCTDMCKMSLEHAPGAKPLVCIALYCSSWFRKWKFPGLWNPDSKIDTDHAELSHNDLLFLISWTRKSSVERSLEHLKWTTNATCTKCCSASNDNIYFPSL